MGDGKCVKYFKSKLDWKKQTATPRTVLKGDVY